MDIGRLKTELTDDLLGRGYADMTNAEAAADLNIVYRTKDKASLTGNEMFTATDATEFAGLTEEKRGLWVSWCGADRDPFDSANVAFVNYVFGGGSDTIAALAVIRINDVSRAVELGLGLGRVRVGDVQRART